MKLPLHQDNTKACCERHMIEEVRYTSESEHGVYVEAFVGQGVRCEQCPGTHQTMIFLVVPTGDRRKRQ